MGATRDTFNESNDKESHTRCKAVKVQRRHNNLAITRVVRSLHTRFGANTARDGERTQHCVGLDRLEKTRSKVPAVSSQQPIVRYWTAEEGVNNFTKLPRPTHRWGEIRRVRVRMYLYCIDSYLSY